MVGFVAKVFNFYVWPVWSWKLLLDSPKLFEVSLILPFCVGVRMWSTAAGNSSVTTTPKAGLCQGPIEPISWGIQSFQRNAALHPSAALSPTTPLQELFTPGRGRISWPRECAMQMHMSSILIQRTLSPSRISFFREAMAQNNNTKVMVALQQ